MTLVGLTALLVGGVGIGNAVGAYLAGQTATIATLKCLGAPRRLVFACYLLQMLALALGGIALGLVLGAAAPFIVAPLSAGGPAGAARARRLSGALGAGGAGRLARHACLRAVAVGHRREVRAASLFRPRVEPPTGRRPRLVIAAIALSGLALAALAVVTAPDRVTALWSVAGAAGALLAFRCSRAVLMAVGAAAPPAPGRVCGWRSPISTARARRPPGWWPRWDWASPCWWRSCWSRQCRRRRSAKACRNARPRFSSSTSSPTR